MGWFWLATFFGGGYAAVVLSFRFAAADGVEPQRRARALSLVMAGGVAAGVVGPHMCAATFLVQAVVAVVSAFILLGVRLPMPTAAEITAGRPLAWAFLVLLGLGWNFRFLGASALVLDCHRPEERTRVQSLNDFIVFGLMVIGSCLSGGLLCAHGWNMVLWVSMAPLLLAIVALAVAVRRSASEALSALT